MSLSETKEVAIYGTRALLDGGDCGVDLERLGDCDAAIMAESVPTQTAKEGAQ